jgi:sulfatase maturation enzyme AslB (radical SAM superfamily)
LTASATTRRRFLGRSACPDGRIILDPGAFYILVSREAVTIPPDYAAEMAPYLAMVGEFRVHYAGFFDPGFGHAAAGGKGSRGVLEVRCHEAPFVLEHGQVVGRLVYERMAARPETALWRRRPLRRSSTPSPAPISYLRVSVTDRCDFRCTYCMAEHMTFLPKADLLTLEELDRLCSAFVAWACSKLRITGGEPLVRRGILTFFQAMARHLQRARWPN